MFPAVRRSRRWVSPSVRAAILCVALAVPAVSAAQLRRTMPESLTDREFWEFFVTNSEDGGVFPSENFVSNEQTYQHIIPTLQRTVAPGGVYLGVGPEQNFTYIANLKPRMAVIFDIRRQNAMAHLMYKAIFELSPTRADFVGRLFSRATPPLPKTATPAELFAAVSAAPMVDSVFDANRKTIVDHLTVKHGFALTPEDVRSINRVYSAFFEAGPDINYGYRPGSTASAFSQQYITYARLQSLTNIAGANMAFLASEENYQVLRAMHMKNLIVPVVGNFSGAKAIRGVGDYLRERGGNVAAFYLSNVEQYLFRSFDDAARFYRNVETLPIDSTSRFIRSVPPNGDVFGGGMVRILQSGANIATNAYSVSITDSAGLRVIRTTTTDSTGRAVTTSTVDTGTVRRQTPLEIFRALQARDDSLGRARNGLPPISAGGMSTFTVGGGLVSGIASIRASLDAFNANRLNTYREAIEMTKTSDWIDEKKRP